MKDTPTRYNNQDFRARYEGTWGLAKGNLVKIKHVREDKVEFSFGDGEDDEIYSAFVGGGFEFEFTQVPHGWYNLNDKIIVYLSRSPQHQWKRGICNNNTSVHYLKATDQLRSMQLTKAALQASFDKSKPTSFDVAALSEVFAINKKYVYVFNRLIGYRSDDTLELNNGLFYQELCDLVRRENYPFKVVQNAI
jgi:hypothetical protein